MRSAPRLSAGLVLAMSMGGCVVACSDSGSDAKFVPRTIPRDARDGGTGNGGQTSASEDAAPPPPGDDPSQGMTRVPASDLHGTPDFFIDPYEASVAGDEARSVEGVVPTVNIDFAGARTACRNGGKRLCTRSEWLAACEGPEGLALGFQDQPLSPPVSTICDVARTTNNTPGSLPSETGSHPQCKTTGLDVWDMIGNASEWTGDDDSAFPSGIAFYMPEEASTCDTGLINPDGSAVPATERDSDIGFRCCFDGD